MSDLDIDAVTDRYLRRHDPMTAAGFVVPRDTFLWANTRAGIAMQRVFHGLRNAGVSMRQLGRATERAAQAAQRFADTYRDTHGRGGPSSRGSV